MLLLLPTVGVFSVFWELWYIRRTGRMRPDLLAPALFILPYSHHVFSRADVPHLAQGAFPLIIYLAVATAYLLAQVSVLRWQRVVLWVGYGAWVISSVVVFYPQQPLARCEGGCVAVRLEPETDFWVDGRTLDDYVLLQTWLETYDATTSFAVYSLRPGLYAINHVVAPVYHTYIAFPIAVEKQIQEIQDIETAQVRMVIISKTGVDSLKETAFRNTNPLTFAHIQRKYTVVESTEYYEAYLRNP